MRAARTFIGSYETVAKTLDAFNDVGLDGIMMTFDDFVAGIETFGKRILPLMKCRSTRRRPGKRTPNTRTDEARQPKRKGPRGGRAEERDDGRIHIRAPDHTPKLRARA